MTKRVKIILASILLITLAMLALHLLIKEPELGEFTLSEKISVINNTEVEYYDDIVRAGLYLLDIDYVYVSIFTLDKTTKSNFAWQQDGELYAAIRQGESGLGQYAIWLDKMSPSKALDIIAHELIHIKQMEEGKLNFEGFTVYWRPDGVKQIYNALGVPYNSRPWEIEAMSLDRQLSNDIEELLTRPFPNEIEGMRQDIE